MEFTIIGQLGGIGRADFWYDEYSKKACKNGHNTTTGQWKNNTGPGGREERMLNYYS